MPVVQNLAHAKCVTLGAGAGLAGGIHAKAKSGGRGLAGTGGGYMALAPGGGAP